MPNGNRKKHPNSLMKSDVRYRKYVGLLILISTLIRAFVAATIELGNDEVYYRLYALYPDWSHFDHPLMVGLTIQLFSLNLWLHSELFIRLGSVILGAVNIWLIYRIGSVIKNERTGFFAALLFTASVYASVITGIFILPDTPQSFFWLLALLLMMQSVASCPNSPMSRLKMFRMGIVIGLAILSKYTSVFLWLGALLYILLYNRSWLKSKWLYFSLAATAIISLPILIWNIQYNFISFTFHGERVEMAGHALNPGYFLTELAGEFLYNNPVNFVLILIVLIAIARKKIDLKKNYLRSLLLVSLPLIITILTVSLFRHTLPHWTAPAVMTLLLPAAAWLDQHAKAKRIPGVIIASLSLLLLVIVLGYGQINYGLVDFKSLVKKYGISADDSTLDMFGFDQAGKAFAEICRKDMSQNLMSDQSILVGNFWFPLANFDYYAASLLGMKCYGIGPLEQIHKYAWINETNGGFQKGMDAYYLTTTREYRSPYGNLDQYFEKILPPDTIDIYRNNSIVKQVFVYRLKNLNKIPENDLAPYKK